MRCRFESQTEHFSTEQEARAAVEAAYASINLRALSKGRFPHVYPVAPEAYAELFASSDYRESCNEKTYRDGRKATFDTNFQALPEEVRRAFFIYWNEDRSADINGLLWGTVAPHNFSSEILAEYKATVKTLDRYIASNAMAEDPVVFKGIPLATKLQRATVLRQLDTLTAGDAMHVRGFTSTSVAYDRALDFAGESSGLILEIVNSRGGFVNEFAEEIILPRKASFAYLGYEVDEASMHIHMRMKQVQ